MCRKAQYNNGYNFFFFSIFQGHPGPMGSIGYPGPRGVKVSTNLVIQYHPDIMNFMISLNFILFSSLLRVLRESEVLKVAKEKR